MARTKQSALKRSGSSSSLPENRPTKMQRSSEKDIKVKLEPGLNNTAQPALRQGSVTIKLEAGVEESRTLVKVKLEPEDVHHGRGVRVKPDPDAVSSSLLQQQHHHRAAVKLEAQEQPVQPRRRESAAAATAAAGVKSEDAKPEHIGYPYGAAAAEQPKRVRDIKGDPEVDHDVHDDEDEEYDEEYDDASDDVDDDPDMGCDCGACMGIDDMYDYDEYGDDMGCDCPHCLALAVSDDSDQYSEFSDGDGDGDEDDGSDLPVWTWGKHVGTPIKDTPGGYIHWLCREPHYFDGSTWKVKLLKQLIAARKVKIVNGVDAESPAVHVIPRVRNDDYDYGYWGYSACGCGCC